MSSLSPQFGPCSLAALVIGSIAYGCGRVLIPVTVVTESRLLAVALRLTAGLIALTGVISTLQLERINAYTALPSILLCMRLYWVRKAARRDSTMRDSEPPWHFLLTTLAVAAACAGFEWWQQNWIEADGTMRKIHSDLGFYVQAVTGVPEAGIANGWAATLGRALNQVPEQHDLWYHWGAIWLAAGTNVVANLGPLASFLIVVPIVLDFALVVASGAVVQRLTRWPSSLSVVVAAVSLCATEPVRAIAALHFGDVLHYEPIQHFRLSLAEALSYKFEGMIIIAAMAAWLWRKPTFSVALLFIAGLSAPHNVGIAGVTAGVLGTAGLILRRRHLWQPSAIAIVTLLASWATVRFLFQTGLPKAEDQSMLTFDVNSLLTLTRNALPDFALGLLAASFTTVGIVHLARGHNEHASDESRALGWIAPCAIIGGFAAYHLFSSMSDRFHFTTFGHAVLVIPVGVWGVAGLAAHGSRVWRLIAIILLTLDAVLGGGNLHATRTRNQSHPWRVKELMPLHAALRGRPFGYFATSDREWWIPRQSNLAVLLGSRCIRLNEIPHLDQHGAFSRYYGADVPRKLVPPQPGESADAWALRFAWKVGIECVLEIEPGSVPVGVKAQAREIARGSGMTLYEITPAP